MGVVQGALRAALPDRDNNLTINIIPPSIPPNNTQNLSPFIAFILFKSPVESGGRLGVLNGGLGAGVRVRQGLTTCNTVEIVRI